MPSSENQHFHEESLNEGDNKSRKERACSCTKPYGCTLLTKEAAIALFALQEKCHFLTPEHLVEEALTQHARECGALPKNHSKNDLESWPSMVAMLGIVALLLVVATYVHRHEISQITALTSLPLIVAIPLVIAAVVARWRRRMRRPDLKNRKPSKPSKNGQLDESNHHDY